MDISAIHVGRNLRDACVSCRIRTGAYATLRPQEPEGLFLSCAPTFLQYLGTGDGGGRDRHIIETRKHRRRGTNLPTRYGGGDSRPHRRRVHSKQKISRDMGSYNTFHEHHFLIWFVG